MESIRLILVDDHKLVREGIKIILETNKCIEVVGEASDGLEAMDLIVSLKPAIVLLDIKMPNMNGLETLKRIRRIGLETKVIILSGYSNKHYIIDAIKAGASGYFTKKCISADLIRAISNVNSGRLHLEQSLENILNENLDIDDISIAVKKIDLLSEREHEILLLLAKGYSNQKIGVILFISEKTVKNHITNVYKKIEVDSRVNATIFAYENKIIEIR